MNRAMRKNIGTISIDKLLCIAFAAAFLVVATLSIFMEMDIKKHRRSGQTAKGRSSAASQKKMAQFKPIEVSKIKKVKQLRDYSVITERNPFMPYTGVGLSKEKGTGSLEKPKKSSILSEVPLFLYRGSVATNGVVKCAIEDVETKEVYFLKKGDAVGEYFVLDIQRDKVILSQKKGGEELVVPLFEQ